MNRKSKPKTNEALPQEDRFMPTVTGRSSISQKFPLLPHRSLGSKTKGVPISIPSTPLDRPSPSYKNKGTLKKRTGISIPEVDSTLIYHTTSNDTVPKRISNLKTLDQSKRKMQQTLPPEETSGHHTFKSLNSKSPTLFESHLIPSVSVQTINDNDNPSSSSSSNNTTGSLKPALLRHSPKQINTGQDSTSTHVSSLHRLTRLFPKTTNGVTSNNVQSKDMDTRRNVSVGSDSDNDEEYFPAQSSFDMATEEAGSSSTISSTIPRLLLPQRPKRSKRLLAKGAPISIPSGLSSDEDMEFTRKKKKTGRLDSATLSAPVELSDEEIDDATDSILFTYPVNRSKGSITISKQDRRRLRPGEFLNDSVIDFYLKWLMDAYSGINGYRHHNERTKQDTKNTHIFSSFFYNRLTQGMELGGQVQYENVRKWTTNIDLFEKKYAIFPINEKWHWYLVLVCNIDKCIPNDSGESDALDTRDRPIMFVLDSLGGTSKTSMTHLTKYLLKEATYRRNVNPVDFVRPMLYTSNVPKQDNSCDCGVFLLHFVDQFLNSPRQFVNILLARDSRHVKWKEHEIKEKRRELLTLFAKVNRLYKEEHDSRSPITC